ncbi:MAG: chitobiase/beta-hexosaminidase C-terminal domain-containing protein [Coriobacteriia bacterium]|nr:chitobiase/beta-hexosaminidase C-terminal domain-containing protein [Coriobacteriia bacterium]
MGADRLAHSVDASGNETSYYSIKDAVNAGYSNKTIIMDGDWNVSDVGGTLDIDDDESITIDMHGHQIKGNGKDTVIDVDDDAKLTLTSSVKQDISFEGYSGRYSKKWYTANTGGLVINGYETGGGGGINMEDDCSVTLDGVTVCGNRAENGYLTKSSAGGVYIDGSGSTLNMKNGATIERNSSDIGGGVYVDEEDCTINMDNSLIKDNYAYFHGAGVHIYGKRTTVNLEKDSKIGWNSAPYGAGVYAECSFYYLKSKDRTGQINDNNAFGEANLTDDDAHYGGGAICAELCMWSENEALVEGITFKDNRALYNGGAIETYQEYLRIVDCQFTGNQSGWNGGALCIVNDDVSIINSTIRDNMCNVNNDDARGGAVYVNSTNDLELSGKCVIRNNSNSGEGCADDIFLQDGTFSTAYITGGVSRDSKIGVRTNVDGDQRIGDKIKNETESAFFIDKEGYYVSYGSDHSGDMWQRKAIDKEFDLTVNGSSYGSYRQGGGVWVEGASSDPDKVFRCWSYEQSSGLEPFSDYVKNIYSPYIYFSMPQNDVSLVAEYMDRQKSVAILLEKPEAGKLLNTKGEIQWEGKVAGSKTVDVSWYEKKGDIYTPATGVAEAGVTYVAKLAIAQDAENGLAFAFDMDSIKASMDGGQTASKVDSYSVDDVGTLNVSISCAVDKETAESIEPESVTVFAGISQAALKDALPSKAFVRAYSGASFYVDIDKDNADLSGLIDDGKVVKPEGGKLTIEIPVSSDEVYFPDDLDTVKVEVTVEDAPEEEVATPELSPAGGTYSTKDDASKFVDGKLKVEASCETEDASIKYKLSYLKDGEWVDGSEKTYSNSIDLDVYEGKQRSYKLEVWAVKSSLESAHATQYYLIDDVQPDEMVTATVKYVDTAMEGHHADWADSTDEYSVKKGQDFVITAPAEEGYAFEKWLDAEGNVLGAEPALSLEKLDENIKITCVYNPVVTELDLGFDLPEAHKELSTEAGYVNAKIADSDEVQDVSEYFKKDGKLALSWQPSGDSEGKAKHNIAYLAALSLAGQVDGVKYTLSSRLTFKINHNKVEGGVYVGKKDDLPALFIECPSTGPYEYKSIADVSDVELSFQQAWAYNANQEAGKDERWGLPKEIEVTYKCGETELLSIEWDKVEGFDKDAKIGQELIATGKVCYPSYVDNDGAPETVSAKISVAAPEKTKAPEASLAPGTYTGTQYVQLGCSADGAVIRYTTDGSDPTEESPVYSGEQIEVASNMTIKARSYAEGYLESDIAEFAYVIEGADPEPGPDPEPDPAPEPDPEPAPEPEDGGSDNSTPDEPNTEEGSESSDDSEPGTKEAAPATGDIPVTPFAMGAAAFACAVIVFARRRARR